MEPQRADKTKKRQWGAAMGMGIAGGSAEAAADIANFY